MRSILRNTILSLAGSFKKPANNITILNGHHVSRYDTINDKSIFREQLKSLSKHVDFINVEEAIHLISKEEKVKRPLIAFTFDDGFDDCYTNIAPVLNDFNVNALFFVNPGYIEGNEEYIKNFNNSVVFTPKKRPMDYHMVKELSENGFLIGNHTSNHIRLSEFDNINDEVLVSKTKIEDVTGKECKYFAWTYGQPSDIKPEQLEFILEHHDYAFSGCNYEKYFFNDKKKVLNRRHFEGDWPASHINYFLSKQKIY